VLLGASFGRRPTAGEYYAALECDPAGRETYPHDACAASLRQLRNAYLSMADLGLANLLMADLSGTHFSEVEVSWATAFLLLLIAIFDERLPHESRNTAVSEPVPVV
jgi:uncharacterized protein YjbI with pentapeptide repeats